MRGWKWRHHLMASQSLTAVYYCAESSDGAWYGESVRPAGSDRVGGGSSPLHAALWMFPCQPCIPSSPLPGPVLSNSKVRRDKPVTSVVICIELLFIIRPSLTDTTSTLPVGSVTVWLIFIQCNGCSNKSLWEESELFRQFNSIIAVK